MGNEQVRVGGLGRLLEEVALQLSEEAEREPAVASRTGGETEGRAWTRALGWEAGKRGTPSRGGRREGPRHGRRGDAPPCRGRLKTLVAALPAPSVIYCTRMPTPALQP